MANFKNSLNKGHGSWWVSSCCLGIREVMGMNPTLAR